VFEAMMHFIYTGAMTANPGVAQDLLRAADKYQLDGLKKRCEAMLSADLRERAAEFPVEDVVSLYQLSERFNAGNLGNACALFALEHHVRIIKSIGAPEYSDLVYRMAPQIRVYLTTALYRLANM